MGLPLLESAFDKPALGRQPAWARWVTYTPTLINQEGSRPEIFRRLSLFAQKPGRPESYNKWMSLIEVGLYVYGTCNMVTERVGSACHNGS